MVLPNVQGPIAKEQPSYCSDRRRLRNVLVALWFRLSRLNRVGRVLLALLEADSPTTFFDGPTTGSSEVQLEL